jgi:hypothetical protein
VSTNIYDKFNTIIISIIIIIGWTALRGTWHSSEAYASFKI